MFKSLFITPDGKSRALTFALVCTLFLLWGLCNGMIDVLNKQFQNSLNISKAQSGLVQLAWYSAYFPMAFPSGLVASKFGYRGGILAGLVIVIVGCLLFVPVTKISGVSENLIFAAFLGALFVVGSGLAFLETVANPYTTVLGPKSSAVTRINLAQSCNGVGWIFGPIIGGFFLLSKTEVINTSNANLYLPYLIVAGIVTVMVFVFVLAPVPDLSAPEEAIKPELATEKERSLSHEKHFVLGILSQFLYCSAQTGIFSFFVNYVKDDSYMPSLPESLALQLPESLRALHGTEWHITEFAASLILSGAFIFFTLGRFSGSVILGIFRPHRVLGLYAAINVLMMVLVVLKLGWISFIALILSYFFMSIMYPTNFALAVRGLGKKTKLGASWMVTAILGGGIMTVVMGWLADHFSMRVGFCLPLVCFVFIAFYGFYWEKFFAHDMVPETDPIAPTH